MRRKTLRALLQLSIFGAILLFILFLNRPQSEKRSFKWTTIRYESTSAALPEARGVCPGLQVSSKPALVVSRVEDDGDPKWLDGVANLYHLCTYTADATLDSFSEHLQVPANRGHEAMGYLTFLIDNYEKLPSAGAVFVHGSRWSWHNDSPDYDNLALLTALNVSSALAPWGYHNLRCDWSASTCPPNSGPPQGSLETSMRAMVEPFNARVVSDAALPRALTNLFGTSDGDTLLGRADAVRSQCCAQFVVARDNIWQHSREEYVALRQWLLDGSSGSDTRSNAAPADDVVAGRILSYLWHILFLPQRESRISGGSSSGGGSDSGGHDLDTLNTRACPSAEECYCRLYGRCNLGGCTDPGRCHGQYNVPEGFRLPADWAATHS